MTKREKNLLGKVAVTLTILSGLLLTTINSLKIYAPSQTRLIEALEYIEAVLTAILTKEASIPDPPKSLVILHSDGRLEANQVLTNDSGWLETNEGYREVTTIFTALDVQLQPDPVSESGDVPRTK